MELDENALIIYVDGSCLPKPRRGGIGFKFIFPSKCNKKDRNFCPVGYNGATNNQMELQACILAIKEARRFLKEKKCFDKIIIYSDSQYVVDNYISMMYRSLKGWKTEDGAPIVNKPLWKDLVSNLRNASISIEIKKIKGHKDEGNVEVDKLAKRSANRKSFNSLIPARPRRKISSSKIQEGSVKMKNQDLLIRITGSSGVVDGEHRYVYEVRNEESEYYGRVDKIWSKKVLRLTHVYLVKVNSNQKYPQIEEVIKEIEKV
jgi:ribonuclease HI